MRQRCFCKSSDNYKHYGGRGIGICKRWNDVLNFVMDMGEPKIGQTLERINNDGDYEPGNCRWATVNEQRNNMRSNRVVKYRGKNQTITQWARELGLRATTLYGRLNSGQEIARAMCAGNQNQRLVSFRGKTQSVGQWADEVGVTRMALSNRLNYLGWSTKRALTEKPRRREIA
jgi:hypothetical protein